MTRDDAEAFPLAATGVVRGAWEEYIAPNKDLVALAGVVATAVIVGGAQFYARRMAELFRKADGMGHPEA
jgi:uncharacterized membrane protein